MKYLYTILLLLSISNLFGQEIKGRIVDNNDKPLEFVSILIKKDSVKVFSGISDKQGGFVSGRLNRNDKYQIILSLIGYRTLDTSIMLKKDESLTWQCIFRKTS